LHNFKALALVEAFFLAHAHHGAGVGAIASAAERHLVEDGGAIHEPTYAAHIGPAQGGVVENAAVLGFARVEVGQHLVARGAQRFGGAVEVEAVARLVLYLSQQDGLALERGRPRYPVAFGQHAHQLGVRVLRNLPDERFAVRFGHPVLGLDADVGVDAGLKLFFGSEVLGERFHKRTTNTNKC
jgi:hypothetical protein